jgi:hypothetical protein
VRRLAFNVFAMLSLLVFLTSVCLWVRSYFVGETFQRVRIQTGWPAKPFGTQLLILGFGWAQGRIGINRTQAQVDATVFVTNDSNEISSASNEFSR